MIFYDAKLDVLFLVVKPVIMWGVEFEETYSSIDETSLMKILNHEHIQIVGLW